MEVSLAAALEPPMGDDRSVNVAAIYIETKWWVT
jgi:hypothetical protein